MKKIFKIGGQYYSTYELAELEYQLYWLGKEHPPEPNKELPIETIEVIDSFDDFSEIGQQIMNMKERYELLGKKIKESEEFIEKYKEKRKNGNL